VRGVVTAGTKIIVTIFMVRWRCGRPRQGAQG